MTNSKNITEEHEYKEGINKGIYDNTTWLEHSWHDWELGRNELWKGR